MPDDLDDIIKALAHPLRREILRWLKQPERYFPDQQHSLELGVCAGQIDQRAGLVTSRKVGQWHFFQRNEAAIEAFRARIGQL